MNWADTILLILAAFFGLPVMAYMVMKFGTAGYFRAKHRQQNNNGDTKTNEIKQRKS